MTSHLPALVVTVPLLTAFAAFAAGWLRPKLCFPVGLTGLGITAISSILLLAEVLEAGTVTYELGRWPAPWGIVYVVDRLNGVVLAAISLCAFIQWISSRASVKSQFSDRIGAFYGLELLFVTGVMGITVTGDAFNLYVLLEIASITAYALIAMGGGRAPLSSLNYVFMGTIGACFYLLGVGYLYIMTGSLNMADLASILQGMRSSQAILVAFVIIIVGVWLKMGFFPLHGWLPNAYTHAPWPATTLIAPLVTKVMAYVMMRLVLFLFGPEYSFGVLGLKDVVVWWASLAVVAGSVIALSQKDLKRMITCIILIEIAYMVGGTFLGNRSGTTGAIFHLVNDVFMTLCVFLAVSSLAFRQRELDMDAMEGLFSEMPFTMGALVTGALSIVGVPPTCGFFSKWLLLKGALEAGHYEFMVALILSSLVCLVLFFRVFEAAYFGHGERSHGHHRMREAPLGMVVPLLVVAIGIVALGLMSGEVISSLIEPALPRGVL